MSGIGPSTAPKQRTRYKHSAYVCDKCRQSHRRCKHDPADDPHYNPDQPRKRKRRERPLTGTGELSAAPGKEVQTHATVDAVLTHMDATQADVSATSSPNLFTLEYSGFNAHSIVTDEQKLMALFRVFVPASQVAELETVDWKTMLDGSDAFCRAVHALFLLHAQDPSQLDNAMRCKDEALSLQLLETEHNPQFYTLGIPLVISFLLLLCEFSLQAPFQALLMHAAQSCLLFNDYLAYANLPPAVVTLMLPQQEAWPVDRLQVEASMQLVSPFFFIFSEVDFYSDATVGSIQDLLSLTLAAFNLAAQPLESVSPAVHHLLYRFYLHLARRQALLHEREHFAHLVLEAIYVLAVHLAQQDRGPAAHLRTLLCTQVELAEHQFGPLMLLRRVLAVVDGMASALP